MTTDQLTPEQKAASDFFPGVLGQPRLGFRRVHDHPARRRGGSSGPFGWDGGYGTSWSSDPREDVVAILMTQRARFSLSSGVHLDFWTSTYQAIDA